MADSKMKYCPACKGPCGDRQNHGQLTPATMIKTALAMEGAFTSHFAFHAISSSLLTALAWQLPTSWSSRSLSDPPEITVTGRADGGCEIAVRLTSMPFIPEYRDPKSPARKRLEKAAREEIIRSFKLRRDRVRDGDIEVDIREGSVNLFIGLTDVIVKIAETTIAGLCYAGKDSANLEHKILTVGAGATGAVLGVTAGSVLGPPGMAIGGAFGFIGGALFGKGYLK